MVKIGTKIMKHNLTVLYQTQEVEKVDFSMMQWLITGSLTHKTSKGITNDNYTGGGALTVLSNPSTYNETNSLTLVINKNAEGYFLNNQPLILEQEVSLGGDYSAIYNIEDIG